jgi:hypothetical protein
LTMAVSTALKEKSSSSAYQARVFLYPSGSASYRRNSDLEVDIFDGVCCDGIG